jgi:4-azaleucine resistance transporter AzlC
VPAVSASPTVSRLREGARAATPFTVAAVLLGTSFGIAAREAGIPAGAAIAMSALANAGSAQIAAVAILAGGGSLAAAGIAALLINLRFLPMGMAMGPSLPRSRIRRALYGAAIVDASWILARIGNGRFDRHLLLGSTAVQWVGWVAGTAIGALGRDVLPDPSTFGVDAVFPAFFLAIIVPELRSAEPLVVAVIGAAIALSMALIAPAGAGIVLAGVAALIGLRRAEAR